MSIIYLVLLIGVALVILLLLAESVIAVTRKPVWEMREAQRSELQLVVTIERRSQDLPFVGADRRRANQREVGAQDERRAG